MGDVLYTISKTQELLYTLADKSVYQSFVEYNQSQRILATVVNAFHDKIERYYFATRLKPALTRVCRNEHIVACVVLCYVRQTLCSN